MFVGTYYVSLTSSLQQNKKYIKRITFIVIIYSLTTQTKRHIFWTFPIKFTCLFLAYSTPWDCIVDFHNTPHGFTLALKLCYYSNSIVPGGLDVISKSTLLTCFTSFTILLEITDNTSYGICAQSAVIPSIDVTARIATA